MKTCPSLQSCIQCQSKAWRASYLEHIRSSQAVEPGQGASFTTKNLGETLFTRQVNSSKLNTSLIVSSLSSVSQAPSPSCKIHARLVFPIDNIQLHSQHQWYWCENIDNFTTHPAQPPHGRSPCLHGAPGAGGRGGSADASNCLRSLRTGGPPVCTVPRRLCRPVSW